jgi:hypothetical protein
MLYQPYEGVSLLQGDKKFGTSSTGKQQPTVEMKGNAVTML